MNVFEHVGQRSMIWVKDMMAELGTSDTRKALHALRAGLQALRDRLSVDEAAHLSAQMPLVIRGMFFEGWRPAGKPLKLRHKAEFLALVQERYAPRSDAHADQIVVALFHVLSRHISAGELSDMMLTLPEDIAAVVGGHERREHPAHP
jgi:uncharacterized protein (DUF2267 family)